MYTTALVMIVRNEQRCLARCLRSIQPWVDRLIVMDTGSTDGTVDLALSLGAEVHHMAWPHDFAAARNAALDRSPADWNIVLDADEWLLNGGELLAALRERVPTCVGAIEVASQFEEASLAAIGSAATAAATAAATPATPATSATAASPGSTSTSTSAAPPPGQARASSWISRILPRGVRYEGVIHEQPRHDLPVHRLPIAVAHDGYLPEHLQGKGDRNQRLLQAALAAQPLDAYLLYQSGKDHEVHDRFALAHEAYQRAGERVEAQAPYRHDLVIRHLFTLKALGRTDEAIHMAEQEMPHWPHSADFYFVVGDVLLDHAIAHPDQAEGILPLIESSWQQCLALGDTLGLEGAVLGRGTYLAAHNLAAFHESLGHADEASHYRALARSLATPAAGTPHRDA